jgi:pimeloyl-ACP methyl ester carboxylesterase
LSVLVASRYPQDVGKLVLIGSGPYEARYVSDMQRTRTERLTPDQQTAWAGSLRVLASDAPDDEKRRAHCTLGALAEITDTYEREGSSFPREAPPGDSMSSAFHQLLAEAGAMRTSGALLRAAAAVRCPVVAIHGDYDPHPLAGVAEPLASVLEDFAMIELERCGHTPWIERHARSEFFQILRREAGSEA